MEHNNIEPFDVRPDEFARLCKAEEDFVVAESDVKDETKMIVRKSTLHTISSVEVQDKIRTTQLSKPCLETLLGDCIIPFLTDTSDQNAASLVSKHWCLIDRETRRKVQIALFKKPSESILTVFTCVEDLRIIGKPFDPRSRRFDDEGDLERNIRKWVEPICYLSRLKILKIKKMKVGDKDLSEIATRVGDRLESFKLVKSYGFGSAGLNYLVKYCRKMSTFSLAGCQIEETNAIWLEGLENHKALKKFNILRTGLKVASEFLECAAQECPLESVKLDTFDLYQVKSFFKNATSLTEFCGGYFSKFDLAVFDRVMFPPGLETLELKYMNQGELGILGSSLKEIDLKFTFVDTKDILLLIGKCQQLETIKVKAAVVNDEVLEEMSKCCKKLRAVIANEGRLLLSPSDKGICALARACKGLEKLCIVVAVGAITTKSLDSIGGYCKKLKDFRLELVTVGNKRQQPLLDSGIKTILHGCRELEKMTLDCDGNFDGKRPYLTDRGLSHLWRNGVNLKWIRLSNIGISDSCLKIINKDCCPSLQRLRIEKSGFSPEAVLDASKCFRSLRYLTMELYTDKGEVVMLYEEKAC